MRIFLTGATGYVGSAILETLIRARHSVTALVRNGEKAEQVAARGAYPLIGNIGEVTSYAESAEGHDGYIHAAFESSGRAQKIDRLAIEMLAAAARRPATTGPGVASSGRFLIYTSGMWVLGNTHGPADEDAPPNPTAISSWRPAHEQMVLEAGGDGLRTAVVRPGIVFGRSRGIVGDMFRDASNGLIRIIGDGTNHWPLVYDRDLADLYAMVAGDSDASGIFHATDDSDETVNDVSDAVAHHMPVPPDVRHIPIAEARRKMGPLADALALDQIVRSTRAHAIGWSPMLHSVSGNAARLFEEWRG